MRYKVRMAEIAVASVQLAPVLGDYAGNQARVLSAVARAAAAGASVVVVPELATSGYAFSSVEEARAVARPADVALEPWVSAAAASGCVVAGGVAGVGGGGVFHSPASLSRGRGVAVYRPG